MFTKKNIGLILLIVGIIGFFYYTGKKSDYSIRNERFSLSGMHEMDVSLNAHSDYLFFIWAVDEETGLNQWANVDAQVQFLSGIKLLHSENIIASASTAEESGGIKRAQNGFEFHFTPENDETVKIQLNLVQGDYVDVEVYENIPEHLNLMPGLSIILALIGVVLFLKGRNKK